MIIFGRNPVREAFRAGKTVEKIYFVKGETDLQLSPIFALAKENRVPISFVDRYSLDQLSGGGNHQGVLAKITDFEYCSLDNLLAVATLHLGHHFNQLFLVHLFQGGIVAAQGELAVGGTENHRDIGRGG